MPGIFINFLLERSKERLNSINWYRRKSLRRTKKNYVHRLQGKAGEPSVPLFGASPGEFGLDWAYTKPRKVSPQGYQAGSGVSKPIVNRSGSTAGLRAERLSGKSEIQESRRGSISGRTDQRIMFARRSSGVPKFTKQVVKHPSYLTSTRSAEKQKPEPSIHRDPYSFY